MIEKEFRPEMLYNKIIKYYIDKRGYDKARANTIAQRVVQRETERRICKTDGCGHFSHDHLRNTGVCLLSSCMCRGFSKISTVRGSGTSTTAPTHLQESGIITAQ